MEEQKILSAFDAFAQTQETYEEAVKKSQEESSFDRVPRFAMDKPGKYSVRILPIAPTQQEDGTWKLDRKGYEYPVKNYVLKIENPKATDKKNKMLYVNIVQGDYVGLSADLLDTYVKIAEEKYGDDEKFIKKVKGNSFDGGLKWNSQRAIYVLNAANSETRAQGIQMLTLSYSQYKELEERKLDIWKKLLQKDPKYPCPISSVANAFPVEITRKEENKKTSYSFNIDVIGGYDKLSEEEMKTLLDTQRIPDSLYRYTRFHMEATIEFLKQYDAKYDVNVMESKEMLETIEKIKMELPTDDKSHFSFDRKSKDDDNAADEDPNSIDALWNRLEKLEEQNIGDKTEEGQELRDDIRAFIDDNELAVRVTRAKTNRDLLTEIDDALENKKDGNDSDETDEQDEEPSETNEESDDEKTDESSDDRNDGMSEDEDEPTHDKDERNDDTQEPAARPVHERRHARPVRRTR